MIVPPIPNMAAGARAGAWFIEGPRDAAFVPEDAMRVARDNPREAPIRAEIYSLFADLPDARQVAAALNARGQRLRQNKRFEAADVSRIIRDPVTMGVFRGNRKRAYDPALDSKPIVYVPVAPLVSEALWKECNVKLDGALDPEAPAQD